uniref:cDNA clone:J033001C17, full insert sequence n=1 Tax=Oryza sativa subsp. japonica TaxID=39947 RepID=B7ELQ0_ORYSJ|nr:unnamed protein product [Oryza sativa Japonica Group]
MPLPPPRAAASASPLRRRCRRAGASRRTRRKRGGECSSPLPFSVLLCLRGTVPRRRCRRRPAGWHRPFPSPRRVILSDAAPSSSSSDGVRSSAAATSSTSADRATTYLLLLCRRKGTDMYANADLQREKEREPWRIVPPFISLYLLHFCCISGPQGGCCCLAGAPL